MVGAPGTVKMRGAVAKYVLVEKTLSSSPEVYTSAAHDEGRGVTVKPFVYQDSYLG